MLSLLNKRWRVLEAPRERVARLSRELGVPDLLARLLVLRGMETPDQARSFLDADLGGLHDPFQMSGMTEAVDRIVRAVEARENITVFCDYDVDGVTSAAFLTHFFRDLGLPVRYYLPDRLEEGYGLNEQAVRKIRESGSTLMITADCGITGLREAALANRLGLDVIITDHHQVSSQGLPEAVAVLNPHQADCPYPFRFLSGVGLVFKLAAAVRGVLHHRKSWSRDRLPNLKQHLDLFVLGTIADVAPLTGENHILSRHGLDVIRTTQKPGLVALKSVAGVEGRLDARSIGFALGPRLNAAGRLGKADSGLHLLTATDLQEALNLAREIDAVNRERKEIQDWTLSEAEDRIEREVDLERDRVIVLASENFHAGVIGIAAARLVEKYFRPTVLIALDGGKGKGSGRSIPRFNLHKAFQDCTDCLEQFGGHAYAAGCTLRESQVEAFRQRMNEVGHRILAEDDLVPELRIDGDMDLGRIDRDLYRHLQLLEPYGAQNPHPVFCARNVRIQGLRFMGKSQNHVRFQAIQDTGRLEAVGFGMAELFESVIPDEDRVDLAFEIQRNTWNGRDKIELRLLDLRKSGEGVSGPA